jgi:hypothetical protein
MTDSIENVTILTSPGQTSNRIYPQDALIAVIEKANNEMLPVGFLDGATPEIPLDKIMGRATNARIEDQAVVCDIEVYADSPGYDLYKRLTESGIKMSFACAGTGTLVKSDDQEDQYEVSEYSPWMVQVHQNKKD